MSKKTEIAERKLRKLGQRFRAGVERVHPGSSVMPREIREIVAKGFSEIAEERHQHLERLRDQIIPERRMRKAGDSALKKEKD